MGQGCNRLPALRVKQRESRERCENSNILECASTPTEGLESTPAQRLTSRRTRTLLPTRDSHSAPEVQGRNVSDAINQKKKAEIPTTLRHTLNAPERVKCTLDMQTVQIKLPGRNTWSLGVCGRVLGQRSYIVEVAGHTYRRNRRQLRSTNELVPLADDQTEVIRSPERQSPNRPVNDNQFVRLHPVCVACVGWSSSRCVGNDENVSSR